MSEPQSLKNPNPAVKAGLFALVVVLAYLGYAFWSDEARNREIASTKDPARLAYLLLDYADESSKSSVKRELDEIQVSFHLGEQSVSTDEVEFLEKAKVVLGHFFASFPDAGSIVVVGVVTTTDVRGQKSEENVFLLRMSSRQAGSVVWDNVQPANLPSLAERYIKSPAYN